jgi:farnesyl diphosphate synthase
VYKTAYYSFYLPVALAMLMHGIPIPAGPEAVFPVAKMDAPMGAPAANPYQLALDILIPLGEYFQVQDDFLDYSGTPEQIGKVGTDIVDNKCSWVVNVALAAATPAQRAVLDANYGKKDARAEQRVKDLYEELGMPARYARYEEDVVARILAAVNTIPPDGHKNGLKREVFTSFLDKIYKRTK